MLKSIFKALAYCACALGSGMAFAAGLGGINVGSSLGQPLKAEIELISFEQADKAGLAARLASPEAFKNAGIEYPYTLPKIKFETAGLDGNRPVIRLSTTQPVNEPFVSLLVEVSWPSGKLLREYTFLLDPPGFAPVVPEESAPVVTVAPVVSPPAPAAVTPAVEAHAAPAASAEQTAQPNAKTEPKPAPEVPGAVSTRPAAGAQTVAEAEPEEEALGVEVKRGDTLGKIAREIKPDEVSLERMLVALYRANTDAFVANNMNRLKAGKILRVPDADEIGSISQKEAVREVRAQVSDWNAYRQRLAQVRAAAGDSGARQEVSGKVTASVSEPAAAGQAPAKEVLKLSKGAAPGDQAGAAGKGDKAAAAEDAIAREKALKEAEDRAALLEKNVKDLQKLAELKAQAAAQAASAPTAVSAPAAAEKPVAVAKPSVPEPAPQPEPSLLDDVLADPLLLGGAGAVVLLLAGGGLYLARRRKNAVTAQGGKDELPAQEIGGATGRIATPVVASPETGDFTQLAGAPAAAAASDEVDPIGEADLFLTFGRDVQAEEILQEALKGNPGNLPVRLKLMGIYANRKDTNSFYTHAMVVKESGDEAAWKQAADMGRALEPANPFYGGDGTAPAPQAVPAATAAPSVDFDLGFGATTAAPATELQGTVVMEQPTTESTAVLTSEELRAAQETPMDFDLTGSQPVAPVQDQPAANGDDMVFDVTSAYTGASPEAASAAAPGALEEMVFDVTATHPGMASTTPDSANSVDDLVFDVTTSQPMPAAPEVPVAADQGATDTGLTFTLDFPTDFKAEPKGEEKPANPAPVMDIGLGDISLNLEGLSPASPSSVESRDERWQEVATKLDLARAYQEMGDAAGAKEILDEVLRDGDEQQRASAQAMLQQL